MFEAEQGVRTYIGDSLRRILDVLAASVGLLLFSPVVLLAAAAVRWSLGRGVLFRHERLGKHGRPFKILKLRTMKHAEPGREGAEFEAERMTPVGTLLRKTSIDELPSLINLLRGDITLVGPRPLPSRYWSRYRGNEYERFRVKPGITGLSQVSGRNLVDWPERLALDVHYVRTRTLRGDIRILLRTVPVVLGRSGISNQTAVTMHELPADRPAG